MRSLRLEIIALFLIVIGVVLLLNALGITRISAGDFVAGILAALLILTGIALLRRSRGARHEPLRDVFVGRIQMTEPGWEVKDTLFQVGLGQVFLDLTKARFSEGQHHLRVEGLMGQVHIRVPRDMPTSASGQVLAGALSLLGQRSEGLVRSLSVSSPGYAGASLRLEVEASLMMGEVRISHPPEA